MAVTLTDKDLEDLARVVEDFRHREAVALLAFLQPRIQAQRIADARAKAVQESAHPAVNGLSERDQKTKDFIQQQVDRTDEIEQ